MGKKRRSPSSQRGRQQWWAKKLNDEAILRRTAVDEIERQRAASEWEQNRSRKNEE